MNSIRRRLNVPIVGGLSLLAVASGWACYSYARHMLVRGFDAGLEAKARAIATLVEVEGDKVILEFSDANMPEFIDKKSPHYFEIWLNDGSVLARSNSLKGKDLERAGKDKRDHLSRDVALPNGKRGRATILRFHPEREVDEYRPGPPDAKLPKATIAVARDRSELDETLNVLLGLIITGAILLPLLAAIIVYVAVRWGLRPVHELTGAIHGINSPTGFNALPVDPLPVELKPIASQLNSMMDRLKAAFDRERQFTMDASHELRTPLAETRTALEVALKWPNDTELMAASCADALDAARNMEGLVSALLALARSESGLIEPDIQAVELQSVAQTCWNRVKQQAAERHTGLHFTAPSKPVIVQTDKSLLTAIVTNLLENAVEYAAVGSSIEVAVHDGEGEAPASISFTNTADIPLSVDDLAHIFEPLWRKETSRTHNDLPGEIKAHTGLGLPLVKSFCSVLHIDLQASLPAPDQFMVTLKFR